MAIGLQPEFTSGQQSKMKVVNIHTVYTTSTLVELALLV